MFKSENELNLRVSELLDSNQLDQDIGSLIESARNGNPESCCLLGYLYLCGIGVKTNGKIGQEYLDKSISSGSGFSAYLLGKGFSLGEYDLEMNDELAFRYFNKGAQLGDYGSMGEVSSCFLYGIGVEKNARVAFDWASKAASNGDFEGMYSLFVCYVDGDGVEKNIRKAIYWCRKALEIDPEDKFLIGSLAECLCDMFDINGTQPSIENRREALELARKAVSLGYTRAHTVLGWYYYSGTLVEKNLNTAYQHYKTAADNGSEYAQNVIKHFKRNMFGNWVEK